MRRPQEVHVELAEIHGPVIDLQHVRRLEFDTFLEPVGEPHAVNGHVQAVGTALTIPGQTADLAVVGNLHAFPGITVVEDPVYCGKHIVEPAAFRFDVIAVVFQHLVFGAGRLREEFPARLPADERNHLCAEFRHELHREHIALDGNGIPVFVA